MEVSMGTSRIESTLGSFELCEITEHHASAPPPTGEKATGDGHPEPTFAADRQMRENALATRLQQKLAGSGGLKEIFGDFSARKASSAAEMLIAQMKAAHPSSAAELGNRVAAHLRGLIATAQLGQAEHEAKEILGAARHHQVFFAVAARVFSDDLSAAHHAVFQATADRFTAASLADLRSVEPFARATGSAPMRAAYVYAIAASMGSYTAEATKGKEALQLRHWTDHSAGYQDLLTAPSLFDRKSFAALVRNAEALHAVVNALYSPARPEPLGELLYLRGDLDRPLRDRLDAELRNQVATRTQGFAHAAKLIHEPSAVAKALEIVTPVGVEILLHGVEWGLEKIGTSVTKQVAKAIPFVGAVFLAKDVVDIAGLAHNTYVAGWISNQANMLKWTAQKVKP
jgi:hypothetical protein